MNWYKFKIELSAVITGTALLTLSALVLMAFSVNLTEVTMYHPLWMRPAALNREVVFLCFSAAIGFLWLCRWQTFRIYRNRRAYGDR